MSRGRLLVYFALAVLGAPEGAGAGNVASYTGTVLIPGIARLQALDLRSNAPCARLRYAACSAALRAEASQGRALRARLNAPPPALAQPIAALRAGLASLAATLEDAKRASDRRKPIGTSALTRRFDLAFQAINGAILRIDRLLPAEPRIPTLLP